VLKLDDGTGTADVSLGLGTAKQGIDFESVQAGHYILVVGKVVAKGSKLHIKPHKVGATRLASKRGGFAAKQEAGAAFPHSSQSSPAAAAS
jgi:hypothetical protein